MWLPPRQTHDENGSDPGAVARGGARRRRHAPTSPITSIAMPVAWRGRYMRFYNNDPALPE